MQKTPEQGLQGKKKKGKAVCAMNVPWAVCEHLSGFTFNLMSEIFQIFTSLCSYGRPSHHRNEVHSLPAEQALKRFVLEVEEGEESPPQNLMSRCDQTSTRLSEPAVGWTWLDRLAWKL